MTAHDVAERTISGGGLSSFSSAETRPSYTATSSLGGTAPPRASGGNFLNVFDALESLSSFSGSLNTNRSRTSGGLTRKRRETLRKITREKQAALTEKSIQRMHEHKHCDSKRRTEGEKLMKFLWKDVKLRATDNLDLTLNHDVVELRKLDPKGTLLKYAVSRNYTDVVAILLRYHSPVESNGEDGLSPLHVAIKFGFIPIFAMLLANHINLNIPTLYEKRTPLHVAVRCNSTEALELLLNNGADPNKGDIYCSTPLHLAARLGRDHLMRILIANGAEVTAIDNEGWTPLHVASEAGHICTVRMLLEATSFVDAQNKYGKTSLHFASASGHMPVVEALLDHDSNPEILDLNGKKAIHYASLPMLKTLLASYSRKQKEEVSSGQKRDFIEFRLANNKSLIDLVDLSLYQDPYAHRLNIDLIGGCALKDRGLRSGREKSKSMPFIYYESDSEQNSVDELAKPRSVASDLNAIGAKDMYQQEKQRALVHAGSIYSHTSFMSSNSLYSDNLDSNPICESLTLLSLGTILEERPNIQFTINEEPILRLGEDPVGSATESSAENGADDSMITEYNMKIFEVIHEKMERGLEKQNSTDTESSQQQGASSDNSIPADSDYSSDKSAKELASHRRGSVPCPPTQQFHQKHSTLCRERPLPIVASETNTRSKYPAGLKLKRSKAVCAQDIEEDIDIEVQRTVGSFRCKVPAAKLIETLEKLQGKVDNSVEENVYILNDIFRDVILLRNNDKTLPQSQTLALENIEKSLKNVVMKLKALRGNFNTLSSEA